jgi:FdhD protein
MNPGMKTISLSHGDGLTRIDHVAIEEPLEIRLAYGPKHQRSRCVISTTMRTPGHDRELAIGSCFVEGIIHDFEDVLDIGQSQPNEINLALSPEINFDPRQYLRSGYTTSACGVCGKQSIDLLSARIDPIPVTATLKINRKQVMNWPDLMRPHQILFQKTGGIHAAAWCHSDGSMIRLFEDVGRHNAFDKLIGDAVISSQSLMPDAIVVVSGRASFELVQKAAVVRVPILVAVGAPSSLAIELADRMGITLIGFAKATDCNVYTHAERMMS